MASVNQIKLSLGGPELTPGTAVSRQYVIPLRAVSDLDKKAERAEDPAIIGRIMASGEYMISEDVSGGIPLTVRPCGGLGGLFKSLLGKEKNIFQCAACIRIRYKGSTASCKLTTNTSDNTLTANTGIKGGETPDATFGVSGVIDFDQTDYDTLAEVISAINNYPDYDCEKVFGLDDEDLTDSMVEDAIVIQGKQMWAYIWFSSSTSNVYRHTFYYDTSSDELPTYSIQKDGYQDNYLYTGCAVNSINISAALKSFVEGDVDILGFKEIAEQTASNLVLEDIDPLIFHKGNFSLGGKDYNFVRNIEISFNNNLNADGYGQGDAGRQYHQKGKFESTGSCSIRMDTDSHAERKKVFTGELISMSSIFRGKEITSYIPELMIVELPYCTVSSFEYEENSGVFDAGIGFKVLYPKGIIYGNPVQVSMLTADAVAY